jgi:hypothetical protein
MLLFQTRTAAIQQAQQQLTGLNKHLTITTRILERVAQINIAQALITVPKRAIEIGIAYNRMLQETTDSLRAMALAGSAQGSLQAATRQSAEVMGILRARANDTGQELRSLIAIFQQGAGVAQQAGIALRDWAQISVEATRAGTNLGLTVEQIRTNLQMIASGQVRETNLLARAIGLDQATIRRAIEAGNLVDVLRAKLAPWQTEVHGLTAAQNRLSNALQEAWGRVALPLFERLQVETEKFTERIEGSGRGAQSFGEILADLTSAAGMLLGVVVQYGPMLARIAAAVAALKIAQFVTAMLLLTRATWAQVVANTALATSQQAVATTGAATRLHSLGELISRMSFGISTATGLFGKMRAAIAAVGATLRGVFLANPLLVVVAAVTAILAGLWAWNLRQRQIAREIRDIRAETLRLRDGMAERLAAITTEAQQTARVRELTAQLLDLEQRITEEKRRQVRAQMERQATTVRDEIIRTRAMSGPDLRVNARAAEERQAREAALSRLPDRLEAFRQEQAALRAAAMSIEERLGAADRKAVAARAAIDGRTAADLDEAEDAIAALRAQLDAERQRAAGFIDLVNDRPSNVAALEQSLTSAEAELSSLVEGLGRVQAAEMELAEAKKLADEERAARVQALLALDIDAIRIAEAEIKSQYAREGGDARAHYAMLAALAGERWGREITGAREAAEAAVGTSNEVLAAQQLSNLERQRAVEIADLALARDRDLAAAARKTYDAAVEGVRELVREIDSLLFSESDVAKRTQLEEHRKRLITEALQAFEEYQRAVQGFGMPEVGLPAPQFDEPPQRATRFERAQQGYAGLQDPTQHYQSAGEGFEGGAMEYLTQLGTVGDQVASTFSNIAQTITGGIANGITGLIARTMTWRQALAQIGTAVLNTIIQSFVEMAAAYMMRRMMMFVFGRKLDAAEVAGNVSKNAALLTSEATTAAATAVAWTPAALVKSIATFGLAALIGAAILAAVLGGFSTGGYTGHGNPDEVAGVVHRREWVVPADVVDRTGPGYWARMVADARSGTAPAMPSLSQQPTGIAPMARLAAPGQQGGQDGTASTRPLNIHAYFSMRRAWEAMRDDVDARFVDLMDKGSTAFL